jgi:ATP-dependent Zn protease
MAQPIRNTAYHEAAHAIASLRRGALMAYVTIIPKPGILGHESSEAESLDGDGDRAYVVGLYAGLAADLELDPAREPEARIGAAGDLEEAAHFIDLHGWSDADILTEARTFVRNNWRSSSL